MTDQMIQLPIECGVCGWLPCVCPSAVEVTEEHPVEVVDLEEEGE